MLSKHPDQLTDHELDHWIRGLVDRREPEGPRLDYKQEIDLSTPSKRRELAKDIVSFANEIGGTLVYGVPESRTGSGQAPIPGRPYGIDLIPGLEQDLENVFVTAIAPLLPEYRIRKVELSEYSGKVCYIVWTPESWAGPHMIHSYQDGRFYRRGQFRSVVMSERDVDERYRRRIVMGNAANEFMNSEDAVHLRQMYDRNQAKTSLLLVPLLLIPNRVVFSEPNVMRWLESNTLWRSWSPSMRGVKTFGTHGQGDRADVELHRNGAIVAWRYTEVNDNNTSPLIAYIPELKELAGIFTLAAGLYTLINYHGPLVVCLTIHCPQSYALRLPRRHGSVALEPSGTSIRIRLEPSASELIAEPNGVLRAVADELFRAFGLWNADCFDAENRVVSPRS